MHDYHPGCSKGWELTRKTLRLLLWATKHCTCPCSMSCRDRVQIFSGSSKSKLQAGVDLISGHLLHLQLAPSAKPRAFLAKYHPFACCVNGSVGRLLLCTVIHMKQGSRQKLLLSDCSRAGTQVKPLFSSSASSSELRHCPLTVVNHRGGSDDTVHGGSMARKLLTCGAESRCCRTYLICKCLAQPAHQIQPSKGIVRNQLQR